MKLETKKQIVDGLKDRFSRAEILILTDYKGLNVFEINELRSRLYKAGVDYQVAKNTLLTRASEGTPFALLKDSFKGPSAVALAYKDPVAPAKILTQFVKDYKKLEIRAAVLNGRLIDGEGVKALSSLPPKEVMLATLLSAMNGVPRMLVTALADVPRRMLNVLNAIKEQKEAA